MIVPNLIMLVPNIMMLVPNLNLFAQAGAFYTRAKDCAISIAEKGICPRCDPARSRRGYEMTEPSMPKIIPCVLFTSRNIPATTNCLIIDSYTQSGRPLCTRAMFIHAELNNNIPRCAANDNIEII